MKTRDQTRYDWTTVLRRQPSRVVEGQAEGGDTSTFEIICCDCGDNLDLDYAEVSPEMQRIRGPYSIADGVAAYEKHVKLHQPARPHRPGQLPVTGDALRCAGALVARHHRWHRAAAAG